MSLSRLVMLFAFAAFSVSACTGETSTDDQSGTITALRSQLAAALEDSRQDSAKNSMLLDSISKLQLLIERERELAARPSTPPPTVVGAWSDGHRTLRIAEDGSYSFVDPSGAITGYWQLDTSSGRLDLSPPLGSRISAQVTDNWTNIAVHLTIGSSPTLNYLLRRQ
jgi:hypothetical protein